jgi:hypothetical protein
MKFRLIYEGDLRPRPAAKLTDIHAIRQQLHAQIKRLWDHHPLEVKKEEWLRFRNPNAGPDDELYRRLHDVAGKTSKSQLSLRR